MTTQALTAFYTTSIGKKVVMAVTGAIIFGYVVGHMAGNLLIYAGPDAINSYAAGLRENPLLLWGTRLVLLIAIPVHILASVQLIASNQSARQVAYKRRDFAATSYAARTMRWSGPILGLFILYHLAHLTFGAMPGDSEFIHLHPYENMVASFQIPWVAGFYILAQICLGLHLLHGGWSLFQSLGLRHPKYNRYIRAIPMTLAVIVMLGNISIPLSVLLGIVR